MSPNQTTHLHEVTVKALNTTASLTLKSIGEHSDVFLTVATRNWILPSSCIPRPNLIFRYCDRQTAGVITQRSISARIAHPSSPLIFIVSVTHRCLSSSCQRNPDPFCALCSVRNTYCSIVLCFISNPSQKSIKS